ncbi:Rne/Rng family ribonuclease [Nocardioides okcheonensis]|uniref:Rne/Rng family ribonuclease n=1 Tax=Nocardioides okcheonensis TaxID=2894081 RepID=UPI001E483BEB|nr:Rne/Rng family ribonuclease [Nocardioides okcheonensis]UFN45892.1 Rne/Rng family ribonuclease [Nocardioides okcheonensis]
MLDSDQPDSTTETQAGEVSAAQDTPAAPVVTRRTRASRARKSAPAAADARPTLRPTPPRPPRRPRRRRPPPSARRPRRRPPSGPPRRRPRRQPATGPDDAADGTPADAPADAAEAAEAAPAKKAAAKRAPARKTAAKRTTKKAAAAPAVDDAPAADAPDEDSETGHAVLFQAPVVTTTRRTRKKAAPAPAAVDAGADAATDPADTPADTPAADGASGATKPGAKSGARKSGGRKSGAKKAAAETTADAAAGTTAGDTDQQAASGQEPADGAAPRSRKRGGRKAAAAAEATEVEEVEEVEATDEDETATDADAVDGDATDADADAQADTDTDTDAEDGEQSDDATDGEGGSPRRRRRRGGRRRRKSSDASGEGSEDGDGDGGDAEASAGSDDASEAGSTGPDQSDAADGSGEGSSRRRRRRRRAGDDGGGDDDDPNTVTRVRKGRSAEDQITAVAGSTRLEAKKQRRREGREAGRRRAPIVSEAEFLARRESVDRVMVIRQREDLTQIGVLEDRVLVEHYVARESQTSLIGNVYLGRVQNVLPSMEAAFIDIGKGRNAVLYAGEVNWSALGHKDGQPRKIESVLTSGQMVLVQVTKDPIGHKGARLTSQVSLAGRFLVYVPDGTTSGISRKLPDTERNRLKTLLKEIVPDTAGVIVRTAAEGASEEELTRDVERLKSRWEEIEKKATHKGSGPQLLYGEPDLTLKVVRDLFTEDFSKLVIEGDDAWDTVRGYVEQVAPDLAERVEKYQRNGAGDVFATYRVEEQISKGLDRKVWLPSGGSLIIDRTEAMTVVDVNTGKFTGSGGNLEETVTKNNLEAAEEIVRQLRLRDIGGIIVVDFIDMVLESNRDLVVRRLVECLGRDRTRHQVAEVTSLGLVQMTRKRIGTGLLEAFSENCEHCHGRGVVVRDQPVDPHQKAEEGEGRRGSRRRGRRGAAGDNGDNGGEQRPAEQSSAAPSPKDVAAMARHEKPADEPAAEEPTADVVEPVEAEPEQSEPAPAELEQVEPEQVEPEQSEPEQSEAAPAEPELVEPERPEPEPAPQATEPEQAPGPEKPRVVTRTRRRSASRPAGPPAALPLATATSGVAGTLPESGLVEPGTAEVEPGATTATDGSVAPAAEASTVEHVPIKRKGSRKR